MAADLGISSEDISAQSPEQLEELVYHLNRQQLDMYRQFQRPETPAATPQAAAADDDLGLDETQYDEGLVKALKAGRKQVAELKAQLKTVLERDQAREAETTDQILDRVFEQIDDTRFGAGPMRGLAAGSDERQRRQAIVNQANQSKQGTLEQRAQAAYKLIYGEKPAPAKAAPILDERRKEWNAAGLARPTQRSGSPEPKGVKKAVDTVARIMKEHGQLDDEELLNGFPG